MFTDKKKILDANNGVMPNRYTKNWKDLNERQQRLSGSKKEHSLARINLGQKKYMEGSSKDGKRGERKKLADEIKRELGLGGKSGTTNAAAYISGGTDLNRSPDWMSQTGNTGRHGSVKKHNGLECLITQLILAILNTNLCNSSNV